MVREDAGVKCPRLRLCLLLGALFLLGPGCIAVPWPHKVVSHCHMLGTVVDDATGQPVAGIEVYLASSVKNRTETKEDGSFRLPAREKWKFFIVFPLGPWDIYPEPEYDRLVFVEKPRGLVFHLPFPGNRYRSHVLEVYSVARDPIGIDRTEINRHLCDNVGVVHLKRFEPLKDIKRPSVPIYGVKGIE